MTADTETLISRLHHLLEAYGLEGQRICVALSGGMDSVVLLHALVSLRAQTSITLSALHVNHGISPNAADWAEFCKQICHDLAVPCDVATLPRLNSDGIGLERAARDARYAVFAEVDADVLCMAHHQNDRAETLLLNLFRGAGPQGLAAMPGTRFLNGKRLLRPFIDVPRSELYAWAATQNVRWIEDESNKNLRFRRNYLRHVVLPAIGQQFPGVVAVLARTAGQMQEQTQLLARLAVSDAQACEDEHDHLVVSKLAQLPIEAVKNVLKHRLNGMGVHIPAARRLEALAVQLTGAKAGAEVFVRFGEIGCHLWRDQLLLDRSMNAPLPEPARLADGVTIWSDGVLTVQLPNGVDGAETMQIRVIGQGQRFKPAGRCRSSVSEMLREQGVPSWVRPRLPSLWIDGRLCWVAGLGFADDLEKVSGGAVLIWQANPLQWL